MTRRMTKQTLCRFGIEGRLRCWARAIFGFRSPRTRSARDIRHARNRDGVAFLFPTITRQRQSVCVIQGEGADSLSVSDFRSSAAAPGRLVRLESHRARCHPDWAPRSGLAKYAAAHWSRAVPRSITAAERPGPPRKRHSLSHEIRRSLAGRGRRCPTVLNAQEQSRLLT